MGDGEFRMAEKEGNHRLWPCVMVRSFRVSAMEVEALVESFWREREREREKSIEKLLEFKAAFGSM